VKRYGLLVCFAFRLAGAADDAPGWLRAVATAPAGEAPRGAPAIVLLDEERVTVDGSGRATTIVRRAVRILTREGRPAATANRVYVTASGKIKEFRAWMLTPSGREIRYGKDRILDVAVVNNDIYNEVRARRLTAGDDAQDGNVFGYEVVEEYRSVFTQLEWWFQSRLPVLTSRYSLTLPTGWTAQAITYNHQKVEPAISGSTYTWELTNLPYLQDELYSPKPDAIVPRLAITYIPGQGDRSGLRSMSDWTAVSRWLTELSDSQAEVTEPIASRAAALTSGAATELAKIQAIGKFAQSVQYVSIQTGIGRGGGYKPHAAKEVLEKQYGDCKDKANLMRALLKAVGIPAYLVTIYSGGRGYVRPDWPSPQQFNHAIIAIKVSGPTEGAPIVEHPQLGRLLFFDPTDPDTPVGELPDEEQGSYALVVAAEKGALLRMPSSPAASNRTEANLLVSLGEQGSGQVSGEETYYGHTAVSVRSRAQRLTPSELQAAIERQLARSLGAVKVASVTPADAPAESRFGLRMDFQAERFGQLMQSRLLVFRPGAVLPRDGYFLPAVDRKRPIELRAESGHQTVRVRLPAGFRVDELPEPVRLESPYGKYQASWKTGEDGVLLEQSLEVEGVTVPAGQYGAVRDFFDRVHGAGQSPVVLVKK
jgi:hypothetical protein